MSGFTVGWSTTLPFTQYKLVEVRFDTTNPGWAYQFRRYADVSGPDGYRFVYQKMTQIPVQAWDVSDPANPKHLNVAFRDQVVDSIWYPWDNYAELLTICASAYDSTGAHTPTQHQVRVDHTSRMVCTS